MSEFDFDHFFHLTPEDVAVIKERFRTDYRLGPALQPVLLRAAGRPLGRFVVVPKGLLRYVTDALGMTGASMPHCGPSRLGEARRGDSPVDRSRAGR